MIPNFLRTSSTTLSAHRVPLAALVFLILLAACEQPASLPEVPDERASSIEITSVIRVPEGTDDLRVWVPLPRTNPYQEISNLAVSGPGESTRTTEPAEGNELAVFDVDRPGETVEVRVTFDMVRKERDAFAGGTPGRSESAGADPTKDLEADRMVPITDTIARIAEKETQDARSNLEKGRRLYDWCVRNMRYDKSGEGWGRGDAVWACDAKRGNCTDFHSVFMAMARSEGVPARFVMGYPLPPDQKEGEVGGYHCWAEFWTPEHGWVPIDASEAAKHPEFTEYYFGRLTPDRFVLSTGRDLQLEPAQAGEPLNFLWKPYVEADGEPVDQIETTLHFEAM